MATMFSFVPCNEINAFETCSLKRQFFEMETITLILHSRDKRDRLGGTGCFAQGGVASGW